ncbi:replication factor A protein [Trifolium repens]|nr:replication factor A protein [Trifolium repens]
MAFNNHIEMGSSSSELGKMFDMIASVNDNRDSWCFKVRVIRLWTVYSTTKPGHLNSLEMILIDEKGTKIHASIAHKLLYLFRDKIFEGSVYKMSNFEVVLEEGVIRTTSHPYQLHFLYKTKVDRCEDISIDMLGLSLTTIGNIRTYSLDYEFLVDVAGLVLRTSSERECVRDGKTIKEVVLHMIDNSGYCECLLSGIYVDEFQSLVDRGGGGLPIIVIQFAKIRYEQGKISVENYLNVTRILINPSMPEIIAFKERFKLKLRIKDGTGQEIFVLFDQEMYELLGKHCHELLTVHEGDNSHCYPLEFDILKGRKLLLKIDKRKIDGYDNFEKPYRVERICQDLSIIDAFDSSFLNEATDSEDDE